MSKDALLLEGGAYWGWCLLEEIRYSYKTLFIMFDIIFNFYNVKQFMDNSIQPCRSIPNIFSRKKGQYHYYVQINSNGILKIVK